MYNSILCRYNEIATKGANRSMFENVLIRNLRRLCKPACPDVAVEKLRGRIFMHRKGFVPFSEAEQQEISEVLQFCFGLDSFSFCREGERSMESIESMLREEIPSLFAGRAASGSPIRFRIRARRSDKSFPLRSKEIEIAAATLVEELIGADCVKVDLTDPEISIGIEVRERNSWIFLNSIRGPGGLPVGCNSPLLALLSGGIDSPVACAMQMQRGCAMDFLTFHSYPYTPMESVDKVRRIAEVLNRFQHRGTLYACNLSELQKLIRDHCDPRARTILYRRMMMRIASRLCARKKLFAIVTGESVGQVASQTIANMTVIDRSVPNLILRPLSGMDKNETILRAKKLGTFDISIEPMIDSCTVFAPDSPMTQAKLSVIEQEEAKIPNLEQALDDAFHTLEEVLNPKKSSPV